MSYTRTRRTSGRPEDAGLAFYDAEGRVNVSVTGLKAGRLVRYRKQFSFSTHGGRQHAVDAARAYRDELLKKPDVIARQRLLRVTPLADRASAMAARQKRDNRTTAPGLVGIGLRRRRRKDTPGAPYVNYSVVAHGPSTSTGRAQKKDWSVKRRGVRQALLEAVLWRAMLTNTPLPSQADIDRVARRMQDLVDAGPGRPG